MEYELKLTFKKIPKSLNKKLRTHFKGNNSEMIIWRNMIIANSRGKLPPQPLTTANLKIIRHFYRTLDYDGLVGSMKPIADGLTQAGIIKDDSWSVLGQWDVSQEFRPKKDGPMLEIIVTSKEVP